MKRIFERALSEREDLWKFVNAFEVMSNVLHKAGFQVYEADKRGYDIEHPKARGQAFHVWRGGVQDYENEDFESIQGWEKNPKAAAEKMIAWAKEHWGI